MRQMYSLRLGVRVRILLYLDRGLTILGLPLARRVEFLEEDKGERGPSNDKVKVRELTSEAIDDLDLIDEVHAWT